MTRAAYTLSHRERVVAKRPGEGLRSRPGLGRSLKARMSRPLRLGASDIDCPMNFRDDPIEPFLHFIVRKAKLDITVHFNQLPASSIAFKLIEVMFTIEFDREAEIEAAEIDNKPSDRYLPPELQSIDLAVAQLLPQYVFGRCAFCAQASRNLNRPSRHPMQFAHRHQIWQPLTRRFQRHPLPMGEGLNAPRGLSR